MKRNFPKQLLFIVAFVFLTIASFGQAQFLFSDSAYRAAAPNSGRIWGYVFGDWYYKSHADSLNRGGSNQYSGIPQSRNAVQFRRLYLGYDYNYNSKFSSELLLAAEDNFPAYNAPGQTATNGDQLSNGKETFFIKLANIKVKNLWKGTDALVGLQSTPAFALLSERIWNYRSIERTIADIRRTPSYDLGVGLQGQDVNNSVGYNLLVANGTSDKTPSSSFKWFYGDIWASLANHTIILDLYADYQRLNWIPGWHHDRQMIKGFIAYNTAPITIGVEGFINNIRADTKASKIGGGADTIATMANGLSFYAHGDIVPTKLRWFARVDLYNPNSKVDNSKYTGYAGISSPSAYMTPGYKYSYAGSTTGAPTGETSTGDPTSKETFLTAGLDFTPFKDIHFQPNIWYSHYASQIAATGKEGDADVVWRLTFFFVFGRHYSNTYNQL
jgi:hypothetical protein